MVINLTRYSVSDISTIRFNFLNIRITIQRKHFVPTEPLVNAV